MCANGRYLFTSESVTEGHPDKMADQISDAILDAILETDPDGRVACETLVTTGLCLIAGEITTSSYVDFPSVARNTIRETPVLMPLPITLAHRLVRKLSECRRAKAVDFLRPDGKSQVTVEYDGDKPVRVDAVVLSTQHNPGVTRDQIEEALRELVIGPVIPAEYLDSRTKVFVNPTGQFITGGPKGDAGLTGRKIIVDTYGGMGHHGGGAFSGKDSTKVDRSASYMARHIAKNIVAAKLADRAEVQLAYAIGVAEPVSVMVNTFGTARLAEDTLAKLVREHFPLTPKAIIDKLELRRPIFKRTAAYGHFGRDEPEFTWEATNVAEALAAGAKV